MLDDRSRTLELGRAVLSSSAAHLELWLTTTITIETQQTLDNIRNLRQLDLIELLASGDVWLGRGNGLYLEIDLTIRGERLEGELLQYTAQCITDAPAWKQLGLKLSLPRDGILDLERLHMNLAYSQNTTPEAKVHRVMADVPAYDVRPPQGIPVFWLKSVRLSMALVDLKSCPKATKPQNSKCPIMKTLSSNSTDDTRRRAEAGTIDTFQSMSASTVDSKDVDLFQLAYPNAWRRDRKRTQLSLTISEADRIRKACSKRQRTSFDKAFPAFAIDSALLDPYQHMPAMIDASLRMSIYKGLRGSPNGIKVKASSFEKGLANIAPNIWRPDYLTALASRSHLMPSINCSVLRLGSRARSTSLSRKVSMLVGNKPTGCEGQPLSVQGENTHSALNNLMWICAQKTLRTKPFPWASQSFCSHKTRHSSIADSNDFPALVRSQLSSMEHESTEFDSPGPSTYENLTNIDHQHWPHLQSDCCIALNHNRCCETELLITSAEAGEELLFASTPCLQPTLDLEPQSTQPTNLSSSSRIC